MNKLMTLALGTLALGLTACGSNGIEGIWVITLDADTTYESDFSCSENFLDAACPEDGEIVEDEWTTTQDFESSPGLIMAEIVGGPRGEAFMFMDDQVIPGAKDDEGVWTFEFDSFLSDTETSVHDLGYTYTETAHESDKVTITFTADLGGHAEGVVKITGESSMNYQESDIWDEDVPVTPFGNIPASTWLEGDETPRNPFDAADCEADPCEIEVGETYSAKTNFTASKTELKEGDDFTSVEHDGNQ